VARPAKTRNLNAVPVPACDSSSESAGPREARAASENHHPSRSWPGELRARSGLGPLWNVMLGAIFLKPSHAKYGLRFCASNSKSSDTSMVSPTNETRWKRYRRLIVEDKDFLQTSMALCTTAGVLVTVGYVFARSIGASYERMKDIETNAKIMQKDFDVALERAELKTKLVTERAELKTKLVEDGVESAIFKARLELISGILGIVVISLLLFKR
jgi:hypothetical protein